MFGLCFTYTLGLLFVAASYAAEPICSCLSRRFKLKEYADLEWKTNATLHLQRMAYQGIASGEWTGQADDIPKTKPGEILAELPMRAPGPIADDVSVKASISDQADGNHEAVDLDSLIGSDDAAEMVFLPVHPTDRYSRSTTAAGA